MTKEEVRNLKDGDIIARKANPSERYIVVDPRRYQISGSNGAESCILVRLEQWPIPLTDKLYFVNQKFYDLASNSKNATSMNQISPDEVISLLV